MHARQLLSLALAAGASPSLAAAADDAGRAADLARLLRAETDRRLQGSILCLMSTGDALGCCPAAHRNDGACTLLHCVDPDPTAGGLRDGCDCSQVSRACNQLRIYWGFVPGAAQACAETARCCGDGEDTPNDAYDACMRAKVEDGTLTVPDFASSAIPVGALDVDSTASRDEEGAGPTDWPTYSPSSPWPTYSPSTSWPTYSPSHPPPEPTSAPTPDPLAPEPTPAPVKKGKSGKDPTDAPVTGAPTEEPTPSPIPSPTDEPTPSPIPSPTEEPTPSPTPAPTDEPTPSPTPAPIPPPTPAPAASERDAPAPPKGPDIGFESDSKPLIISDKNSSRGLDGRFSIVASLCGIGFAWIVLIL